MRNIYDKIKAYLQENEDILTECVEQLDDYNGYLGDDRYYSMDMLDEFYSGVDATEILNRAYYGRDDESFNTDASGNKIYNSFNPNRDYFYYNGYGNLCSTNYKDYSDKLDDYLIEELANNRQWIDAIDDDEYLSELFEELEKSED
jgi:hypothetical protein